MDSFSGVLDPAGQLAFGQRDTHAVAGPHRAGERMILVRDFVPADGVAAAEHGQRAQRIEPRGELADARVGR